MITQSFINEKLKDFNYYKNKLPLYLQNSYGFIEHFKIWYDVLCGDNKGVIGNGEILLNLINIFDENYLSYLEEIGDNDILDKIGLLFGVTRNVDVQYVIDSITYNETITLENYSFLIYIKFKIIQNYCDGTLKQINEYYKSIGVNIFVINGNYPATANLYLFEPMSDEISNVKKLFLSGKLKIQSMGISYEYLSVDASRILHWDIENSMWEGGQWGA